MSAADSSERGAPCPLCGYCAAGVFDALQHVGAHVRGNHTQDLDFDGDHNHD